jgi:CBS domain-containing membrane protein
MIVFLQSFIPERLLVGRREQLLSCLGAAIGLLLVSLINRYVLGGSSPWLIPPLGASAVLLFAAPASPLAQPWAVLGGNTLSGALGLLTAQLIPDPSLAAGLAVSVAIGAMFLTRSLHPPAGAIALTAAIGGAGGGQHVQAFMFISVLAGSSLLLGGALVFNNLVGRTYPHRPHLTKGAHLTADPPPSKRTEIFVEDLNAALESHGELLDVGRDDLRELLVKVEQRLRTRKLDEVYCRDIMSRDVVSVAPTETLTATLSLLETHKLHLLPVVGPHQKLLGVISLHDIYIASVFGANASLAARRVADVMVSDVRTLRPGQAVSDLAEKFSDEGLHHLPVVDEQGRVLGMISQSDFVAMLLNKLA